MRHKVNRVDVCAFFTHVVLQLLHHGLRNLFTSMSPDVEHFVVAFLIGDDPSLVVLHQLQNSLFRLTNYLLLVRSCSQVTNAEG